MIFLSSDSQIAYYHAPKNGSRTMLGYLALTKEPNLFEEHPRYFEPVFEEVYEELRSRVEKVGRHHYLPEFYTAGFAQNPQENPPKFWHFDIQKLEWDMRTPKNTGVRGEYYTVEDQHGSKA